MLRGRVIKYGDGPQKETWQLPVSEPVKRERCLKKQKQKLFLNSRLSDEHRNKATKEWQRWEIPENNVWL